MFSLAIVEQLKLCVGSAADTDQGPVGFIDVLFASVPNVAFAGYMSWS